MKLRLLLSPKIILVFFLAIGCSSRPAKQAADTGAPSIEAKQLANEQESRFVAEIDFAKGSPELTVDSKHKMRKLNQQALLRGEIDTIKVITWADKKYPSKDQQELSDKQEKLVKKRNEEIKDYMERILENRDIDPDFELISMAERPNFIKELLATDDARIKKSLESAGDLSKKYSKSIILILMKQE